MTDDNKKIVNLNKKRKSFYRYLYYVKGLMYYFLPMYQKQTNIQILGKNKISGQKVAAATKAFFFETLGSTAVDVLSAIDDQINKNINTNFGSVRVNSQKLANQERIDELIQQRLKLRAMWKTYIGVNNKQPSKFCTSKLESKKVYVHWDCV